MTCLSFILMVTKINVFYKENWKRTELQLRDEVAHSYAMLMCETFEELGSLAFDLLSSSLRFVTKNKAQSNKSRREINRFWERFLGAVKPLKLEIDKQDSSLYDTQKWLVDGGTLSAVRAFLLLEKYDALGSLKDVQEMMSSAGNSVALKQKLVSHLYRINREELVLLIFVS